MRTGQQDNEEESDMDNMQQEKGDKDNMQEEKEEDELEELPDADTVARKAGTCVVALYEGEWFLAEVYQDQSGVGRGYKVLQSERGLPSQSP